MPSLTLGTGEARRGRLYVERTGLYVKSNEIHIHYDSCISLVYYYITCILKDTFSFDSMYYILSRTTAKVFGIQHKLNLEIIIYVI